jgi:hypothetical protein
VINAVLEADLTQLLGARPADLAGHRRADRSVLQPGSTQNAARLKVREVLDYE